MHKLTVLIGVLLIGALAPQAIASGATVGKQDGQVAFADFSTRSGHRTFLNLVAAIVLDQEVPQTLALAGRLPCHKVVRDGRSSLVCDGTVTSIPVTPPNILIDPALRQAHLSFNYLGMHNVIDWSAVGTPVPESSTTPYVGLYEDADASGRLFGKTFSAGRDQVYGYMLEYAMASTSAPGLRLWQSSDGTFHVHASTSL